MWETGFGVGSEVSLIEALSPSYPFYFLSQSVALGPGFTLESPGEIKNTSTQRSNSLGFQWNYLLKLSRWF